MASVKDIITGKFQGENTSSYIILTPTKVAKLIKKNGTVCLDLRTYEPEGQILKATTKGTLLPINRLKELCLHEREITALSEKMLTGEAMEDVQYHLGNNVFATAGGVYNLVSVREFFYPGKKDRSTEEAIPTKRGISLTPIQWRKLALYLQKMSKYAKELDDHPLCQASHSNQESFFDCQECYPRQDVSMR